MDLGISGKQAIVCGASQGLGLACARALSREGVNLTLIARSSEPLQAAVESLSQLSAAKIRAVVGDITTDEGRDAVLQACPMPDILINNAGGPSPGDFRDWGQREWFDAVNSNMYSAIDMIRRTLDGMAARGFGRIVNITSVAVKSPMPGLGLSNGARAGLSGFVAGVAREKVRDNVTINNLLPGLFATDRGRGYLAYRAALEGVSAEAYEQQFYASSPAGRMGDPDEFGATCAFLCSAMNAYMSGQNILLDGGAYPGTY